MFSFFAAFATTMNILAFLYGLFTGDIPLCLSVGFIGLCWSAATVSGYYRRVELKELAIRNKRYNMQRQKQRQKEQLRRYAYDDEY